MQPEVSAQSIVLQNANLSTASITASVEDLYECSSVLKALLKRQKNTVQIMYKISCTVMRSIALSHWARAGNNRL